MCDNANSYIQVNEEEVMNTISLSFEPNITLLAGFPFGKSTYQNQTPESVNLSGDFYIKLPVQMKSIASSFVNGFFDVIVSKIGLSKTIERVHIIGGSDTERIQRELKEDLLKGFEDDDE